MKDIINIETENRIFKVEGISTVICPNTTASIKPLAISLQKFEIVLNC